MQKRPSSLEYDPTGHARHLGSPVLGWKNPVAHGKHTHGGTVRFPKVPSGQAAQLPALESCSPSAHRTVGAGVGACDGRGLRVGVGVASSSSSKSDERAPVRVKLSEEMLPPESHKSTI